MARYHIAQERWKAEMRFQMPKRVSPGKKKKPVNEIEWYMGDE